MLLTIACLLVLAAESDRLVTGTGLRLRSSPDPASEVVEKVALGSVLPCIEESKPVTVGQVTAPFCKSGEGERAGWYFTAITEPVERDREAQLARLAERASAAVASSSRAGAPRERWPDVYEVHSLLRRRIDDAADRDAKLRARLAEAAFVAAHPEAFHADSRIVTGFPEGRRFDDKVFQSLVDEARGTAVEEEAAWALYKRGLGGECEADSSCHLLRLHRTACKYLERFPKGPHAVAAVDDLKRSLVDVAVLLKGAPVGDAQRSATTTAAAKIRTCLQSTQQGDVAGARQALDDIERLIQQPR